MITYIEGDLFTSQAQTLVNTVNTVGVMGKGLAKAFKNFYPDMFEDYRRRCKDGTFGIGHLLLYRSPHKWVLSFPTKRHWRRPSRVEDIEAGLRTFCRTYAEQGITSAAFPQLGCGHGGLDWETQVRPMMERYLGPLAIDVAIHVASGQSVEPEISHHQMARWLEGDSLSIPYDTFHQDLVAEVSRDRVEDWTLDGTPEAIRYAGPGVQVSLGSEDLFDLWRQLRSLGYLVPEDVTTEFPLPEEPVFALLTALPYVMRARVVRLSSNVAYDVLSTRAILDRPEAQGVQFVPPLFLERHGTPPPRAIEDDGPWSASQMTSQLALFSTS